MSRTIRRKKSDISTYTFKDDDLNENGILKDNWRFNRNIELTLQEGNKLVKAWFHSCKGPNDAFCPGKEYRQAYRAKAKHQFKSQLLNKDFEEILIDERCNDWDWWS